MNPTRHKLAFALPLVLGLSSLAADACERCQKWGPFYKETKTAMTQMDTAMTQADGGLIGDPDRDFIALMIPHHQGAIDMAKAVVLHGTDPALKNIAQEVIAEQSIEIAYLEKIRDRLATAAPLASPSVGQVTPDSDYRFVANEEPAPEKTPPAADRSRDRVYTGDQVSTRSASSTHPRISSWV